MIVPAAKKRLTEQRFQFGNIRRGDKFYVDSGLGGSCTLIFDGFTDDGQLIFRRPAHGDFPEVFYRYADTCDSARHLYELVPENPHLAAEHAMKDRGV